MTTPEALTSQAPAEPESSDQRGEASSSERPIEIGGPPGPDPTRYGDWEKKGRCIDF